MSSKSLAILIAALITGFPGPVAANEDSKRVESGVIAARTTATILPGVRVSWSSSAPGRIVSKDFVGRGDVSRSVVRSDDKEKVIYYVDFS